MRGLIKRYSRLNWVLLDQAMVSFTNFATMVLIARHLGIEEFGRFALAWAVLIAVFTLQYSLVLSPLMSIGSKLEAERVPAYFGAVIAQQIALAILSFVLLWFGTTMAAVLFPAWRLGGLAVPLAFASFTYQIYELCRRYFFTVGRPAVSTTMDFVRCFAQLLLLVWFFKAATLTTAGTLAVIGAAFAIAALLGTYSLGGITWDLTVFCTTTRRHWHFSKWLVASALMQWVVSNVFLVTAGAVLGVAAVGALKAAQSILNAVNVLFEGIGNLAPIQAGRCLSAHGIAGLDAYISRLTRWGLIATLAIVLPAAVVPSWILRVIYGQGFGEFGWILAWWAGLTLLSFATQPLQYGLAALEETKPVFVSRLIAALVGISAAFPVTVAFGLPGVMGGITVLTLVQLVVPWIAYQRVRRALSVSGTVLPPYWSD
jgi:O-antigen/teichoic acid export membrane protein